MSASITRIDAADLGLETAAVLAAIDNAALDGVPLRHHTPETFLLELCDRAVQGPDEGVWLAHEDGELVGWASLALNRHENLHGAKILGAVRPDRRRRGTGRLLLEAAESATDRPRLRAPAWAGTAGAQALPALGYQRRSSHDVRRLDVHAEESGMVRDGAEAASQDYDVERFGGRVRRS